MLPNEQVIEEEIQAKNLNAPRVTPQQIDNLMEDVVYWYQVIPDTTTTIAVAFDRNGFSLATGLSACADPDNFDEEIGKKIAIGNAERKAREELWRLEGYKLKRELYL